MRTCTTDGWRLRARWWTKRERPSAAPWLRQPTRRQEPRGRSWPTIPETSGRCVSTEARTRYLCRAQDFASRKRRSRWRRTTGQGYAFDSRLPERRRRSTSVVTPRSSSAPTQPLSAQSLAGFLAELRVARWEECLVVCFGEQEKQPLT